MNKQKAYFKWHSHALRALGSELITNNLVAILELVKNSYDAFANNVLVEFLSEDRIEDFLNLEFKKITKISIIDNGIGMNYEDVIDYWFTIGTPNKEINRQIRKGNNFRYVTGSKGIGRLSSARLGDDLRITTKKESSNLPIQFSINWQKLFNENDLPEIEIFDVQIGELAVSGTKLEISKLNHKWSNDDIEDLSEGLSRFKSPFIDKSDLKISLIVKNLNGQFHNYPIEYEEFLDYPIYKISGKVNQSGDIQSTYEYQPIESKNIKNQKKINLSWQEIIGNLNNVKFRKKFLPLGASCGSFEFEIRCWDIDTTSTDKISNLFDINKSKIRESISYYKGLSVYRDQVLVLPKDEGTRDWLGIDLRRISHVGERISTNQIIGCAYITSDNNPNLKDASDREGFAENRSVEEFKLILTSIIKLLETERSIDKEKIEPSITSLFKEINAERILRKAEELYKKNAIPENYLATIKEFNSDLNKTRRKIEENFKYYGQLATLGQISGVILHEIRTGLSSIGTFFIKLEDEKILLSEDLQFYLETANKSVERLDNLANQFTKFASRKAKKNSLANLKDSINSAIQLLEKDISDNNVKISIDNEMDFSVIIDNADLITVIINILLNAIYWVSTKNNENNRKITISSRIKDKRILLKIEDNGPGVDEKDIGVIFQPGITRKPDGIGMGLPISVYLLDNFKSRVFVEKKGSMTGASFVVELFLSEE